MTTAPRLFLSLLVLLALSATATGCVDDYCEGRSELWGGPVRTTSGAIRVHSWQMMLGGDPHQQAFQFRDAETDEAVVLSGTLSYRAEDGTAADLTLPLTNASDTGMSASRPFLVAGIWTVELDLQLQNGATDSALFCHIEAKSGGSVAPPSDVIR